MDRSRLVRAESGLMVPPAPQLVTVPNVEILEVGEDWLTSTGVFTFEVEDLQSAIASQDDPAVRTPVIKLGHTDPRFDGQPSVGRALNLRTTNNDQTLVCDYVGMPFWLGAVLSSAYPRRSIEGEFFAKTRTGNEWPFMLTAVALLGDAYPAIDTLEDLEAFWGNEPPELVDAEDLDEVIASTGRFIRAFRIEAGDDVAKWQSVVTAAHDGTPEGEEPMKTGKTKIRAAVSVDDIRMAYYDGLGPGEYWWWIRAVLVNPAELIVDTDEGALLRVPYTIGDDDTIVFGDAVEVKIEYVDVAAGAPTIDVHRCVASTDGQVIAAKYGTPKAAGRPEERLPDREGSVHAADDPATVPGHPDGDPPEVDVKLSEDILKALGLAPDADEDTINKALGERLADGGTGDGPTTPEPTTPPTEPEPTEPEPTTPEPTPPTEPEPTTPEGLNLPDGMVLVDAATVTSMKDFMAGQQARDAQAADERRKGILDAAITAGKFPRARREHYESLLKLDPEGTEAVIASLTPGLVPIVERGVEGGEVDPTVNAYPDSWRPSVDATRRAVGVGRRVKSAMEAN